MVRPDSTRVVQTSDACSLQIRLQPFSSKRVREKCMYEWHAPSLKFHFLTH